MRVIKKYSNRRLYDTSASAYVNLDRLAEIIQGGELVQVVDAQSGEDLTRAILMQVILETQGTLEMLPVGLLHRMIRLSRADPMFAIYRKQLSIGLELLDAQTVRMEQQLNILKPDPPPPPQDNTEPPSEPPAEPPEDRADHSESGTEMDALRARLAALEARLQNPKG